MLLIAHDHARLCDFLRDSSVLSKITLTINNFYCARVLQILWHSYKVDISKFNFGGKIAMKHTKVIIFHCEMIKDTA